MCALHARVAAWCRAGALTPFRSAAFLLCSTVQFKPDFAGMFTVSAMVNDGCNPAKTSTKSLTAGQCASPMVKILSPSTTPYMGGAKTGAQRVWLNATINDGMVFERMWPRVRGARWYIDSWPGMNDATPVAMPTILNAKSMQASFMPARAGVYVVRLAVDNGCFPLSTAAGNQNNVSYRITVSCGADVMTPTPQTALMQSGGNGLMRLSETGSLTVVYNPNDATRSGNDVITWVGEPNCPSVQWSRWADVSTVQYTCPAPYTVKVVAVAPTVLQNVIPGQLFKITVNVGNANGGVGGFIPDGLLDPNFRLSQDSAALIVTIDGSNTLCQNAYVSNFAAGEIVCTIMSFPGANVAKRVDVTLNGISSSVLSASGLVTFASGTQVLGVTSSSGDFPTVGGSTITISGNNLAFPVFQNKFMFNASRTQVWVGPHACTNVQVVSMGFFTVTPQLTCTLPRGFGRNLTVAVISAFDSMSASSSAPVMLNPISTSPANILTYNSPKVIAVDRMSGPVAGGYWIMATVQDFGPEWMTTPDFMAPYTPTDTAIPNPYDTLSVNVWWDMYSGSSGNWTTASNFKVVRDETTAGSAMVAFQMPAGCGALSLSLSSCACVSCRV
jgi:hypothetical protein